MTKRDRGTLSVFIPRNLPFYCYYVSQRLPESPGELGQVSGDRKTHSRTQQVPFSLLRAETADGVLTRISDAAGNVQSDTFSFQISHEMSNVSQM